MQGTPTCADRWLIDHALPWRHSRLQFSHRLLQPQKVRVQFFWEILLYADNCYLFLNREFLVYSWVLIIITIFVNLRLSLVSN
jgi:hypothetical protein